MLGAPCVLGLDAGLTVTKVVAFELRGQPLASASRRVPQHVPAPDTVERDPEELWQAVAEILCEVTAAPGVIGRDVLALGITGHGDGLYLVADDGSATRRGILSLDSRARPLVASWAADGTADLALTRSGQVPRAHSQAALLSWLSTREPEVLDRSRWAMSCKDFLKLRLTGEASTDPTDASASFTGLRTQRYDSRVLELYDLGHVERLLPPVAPSCAVAGRVTGRAAQATGLPVGTPVVSGLHDVDACAVGVGNLRPGDLTVVAGTFSVNEVSTSEPVVDARWCAWSSVDPGFWMHVSLSPTSATNLEWFVQRLCSAEVQGAVAAGTDPFAFVEHEVRSVASEPRAPLYLPFLHGDTHSRGGSATLTGFRSWHGRQHALRAVLEGITFSHRWHVQALGERFDLGRTRLTGGAARSSTWTQLFADVLDRPVEVTRPVEAGALGAALCAAVGAGRFDSLAEAASAAVRVDRVHEPDRDGTERLDAQWQRWTSAMTALADLDAGA